MPSRDSSSGLHCNKNFYFLRKHRNFAVLSLEKPLVLSGRVFPGSIWQLGISPGRKSLPGWRRENYGNFQEISGISTGNPGNFRAGRRKKSTVTPPSPLPLSLFIKLVMLMCPRLFNFTLYSNTEMVFFWYDTTVLMYTMLFIVIIYGQTNMFTLLYSTVLLI